MVPSVLGLVGQGRLLAQDQPGAAAVEGAYQQILVMDVAQVIRRSTAAQDIQAQIDVQREAAQEEFAKIEEELRAIDAELAEQRASLDPAEFERRRRDFEEQIVEAQTRAQARRVGIERAQEAAIEKVKEALETVVIEIARARRVSLVLDRADVVLASADFDISGEALARLNELLPKVDVVVEAVDASDGSGEQSPDDVPF